MLKLMYITNDPRVALTVEQAGVDRVFVDMETVGKELRQGGMNTVQSRHTVADVIRLRQVLTKADLLVRVNPVYPGSEAEVDAVIKAGADIVKLFPISTFGPGYLKAIKAPLSHIPMMAVGGINEKNIAEYLAAGAIGVGVGGNLANKTWIDAGEYHKITEVAKAMVAAL